jgi:hypothetical protein
MNTKINEYPFDFLLRKRVWNIQKTKQGTIIKLNKFDTDPSIDIKWDDGTESIGAFHNLLMNEMVEE